MNPAILVEKVEDAGFFLSLDEADIIVSSNDDLTIPQREFIRYHKVEIVELLKARELEASTAGSDISPANDSGQLARFSGLPSDLTQLAIRFAIEFYADTTEQVKVMLDDLSEVPDDWDWWRQYFMKKLEIPPEVQCCNCRHCEATSGNLGRCLRGIRGPGASSLWWMTDTHLCIQFSAVQGAA